jgi:hypothetical protein
MRFNSRWYIFICGPTIIDIKIMISNVIKKNITADQFSKCIVEIFKNLVQVLKVINNDTLEDSDMYLFLILD